jgi:hypothetical protein
VLFSINFGYKNKNINGVRRNEFMNATIKKFGRIKFNLTFIINKIALREIEGTKLIIKIDKIT